MSKTIILTLCLITLACISNGQSLKPPYFGSDVEFFSKKMRVYELKGTNSKDHFQDAKVTIHSSNGEIGQIKIDVPNVFFFESLILKSTEYKRTEGSTTLNLIYMDSSGKLCFVAFVYLSYMDTNPSLIRLIYYKDKDNKVLSNTLQLYDFNE